MRNHNGIMYERHENMMMMNHSQLHTYDSLTIAYQITNDYYEIVVSYFHHYSDIVSGIMYHHHAIGVNFDLVMNSLRNKNKMVFISMKNMKKKIQFFEEVLH